MIKKYEFKDKMGRWRTKSLFAELSESRAEGAKAIFARGEGGIKYVELNDPTGYKFANEYLGGWKHFKALKEAMTTKALIESWEEELDMKLRCLGVENMVKLAQGEKGYQASKFLLDGGWKQKTAGRPTKKAIQKETKLQAQLYDEFSQVVEKTRRH